MGNSTLYYTRLNKMFGPPCIHSLYTAASKLWDYGIKTGSGEFCCNIAWGRLWNRNDKAIRLRDWRYCLHKPKCIVTTKPDRWVLIMIITWQFFHFTLGMYFQHKRWIWCSKWELSHVLLQLLYHMVPLNDGNCHLTMSLARGTVLMTCCLTPLILTCSNPVKINPQE